MRKILILGILFLLVLSVACGGGGESSQAKGEAKHVAAFLDDILQKGDLNGAYEMLTGSDRAMLGSMPGFYDFITGKDSENMDENMRLVRVMIEEFTPVPSNLIRYDVGEPEGQGDTVTVPVTFYMPKENMEQFFKDNMDPELYDQVENIDNSDLTFDQKRALIVKAADEVRNTIKGKTFEMDSNTNDFLLIKEDGKWKLSILGSGLMNMLGGM